MMPKFCYDITLHEAHIDLTRSVQYGYDIMLINCATLPKARVHTLYYIPMIEARAFSEEEIERGIAVLRYWPDRPEEVDMLQG